jgi:hypothetical protein
MQFLQSNENASRDCGSDFLKEIGKGKYGVEKKRDEEGVKEGVVV